MASYQNPLPYAVGVIPAMCNHQSPVSLHIPEVTSTWTGKDIPIETFGTGAPVFHISGKAMSWSGRKSAFILPPFAASPADSTRSFDGRERRATSRAYT
jgi:hypothetical protein